MRNAVSGILAGSIGTQILQSLHNPTITLAAAVATPIAGVLLGILAGQVLPHIRVNHHRRRGGGAAGR
jgi:hypothetical protein